LNNLWQAGMFGLFHRDVNDVFANEVQPNAYILRKEKGGRQI